MKHFEDQARQRVNDAIQTGMRSQAVQRALAERKPAAFASPQDMTGNYTSRAIARHGWIVGLFSWLFGLAR
jgi:hypothetical protein